MASSMATAMASGNGCGRYVAANDDKDPNTSQVLKNILIHEKTEIGHLP